MVRNFLVAALVLAVLPGCRSTSESRDSPVDGEPMALASRKQIVSPSGVIHRVYPPSSPHSPCWLSPNDPLSAVAEFSETPSAAASGGRDSFSGTKRKAVKTSIASGPELDGVASIADLYAWIPGELDRDEVPDGERVDQENFNATVAADMIAAKFEGDNDYHIILTDPEGNFWTAEVSGLPRRAHPDYGALKEARDQFHEMVTGARPTASRYDTYAPPIPVVVSGSLFFDSEHTVRPACGPIGPGSCKPCTAWELHPVTSIRFADE